MPTDHIDDFIEHLERTIPEMRMRLDEIYTVTHMKEQIGEIMIMYMEMMLEFAHATKADLLANTDKDYKVIDK